MQYFYGNRNANFILKKFKPEILESFSHTRYFCLGFFCLKNFAFTLSILYICILLNEKIRAILNLCIFSKGNADAETSCEFEFYKIEVRISILLVACDNRQSNNIIENKTL